MQIYFSKIAIAIGFSKHVSAPFLEFLKVYFATFLFSEVFKADLTLKVLIVSFSLLSP